MIGTIAGSVIGSGASGVLVPLGIENFMDINTALMYYNYISVILLMVIAAFSGSRGEAAYCVLIPIFAGMFMLFGWLHYPVPSQALAVTVIAGVLGVMIYMNETNRERNGLAGPGSKLLNIVFFIILVQVCMGLVPQFGMFDSGNPSVVMGQTYCPPGATCNSYGNVDFTQSASTTHNTGGILSGVVSVIYGLTTAFIAMLGTLCTMIIQIFASTLFFNSIIEGLFPGVSTNLAYIMFMGAVQCVFWAVDFIFISNVYLKLFPSEGSI